MSITRRVTRQQSVKIDEAFERLEGYLDEFACFEDISTAAQWYASAVPEYNAVQPSPGLDHTEERIVLLMNLHHLVNLTCHHIIPYLKRREDGYDRTPEVDLNAVAAYIGFRRQTPPAITRSDKLKDVDNGLICFYLNVQLARGSDRVIDLTRSPRVLMQTFRRDWGLQELFGMHVLQYRVYTETTQTRTPTIGNSTQPTGTTRSTQRQSSVTSATTGRTEVPDTSIWLDDPSSTLAYDPTDLEMGCPTFSMISTTGPLLESTVAEQYRARGH
jgi:hypothetical protein